MEESFYFLSKTRTWDILDSRRKRALGNTQATLRNLTLQTGQLISPQRLVLNLCNQIRITWEETFSLKTNLLKQGQDNLVTKRTQCHFLITNKLAVGS